MIRFFVAALCSLAWTSAAAEAILYIGSSDGRILTASGESATINPSFSPQKIVGFFGYGPIRLSGQCLEAQKGDQSIKWKPCNSGDPSQVWRLRDGRLSNLTGVCASYDASNPQTQAPVRSVACAKSVEQTWVSFGRISSQSTLRDVTDPTLRSVIEKFLLEAAAGARLKLTDEQTSQMPPNVILWDQSLVAADRKGLVYGPL